MIELADPRPEWLEEEWRQIPGFPGYDVSSFGRIRTWLTKKPKLMQLRWRMPPASQRRTAHSVRLGIGLVRDGKKHSFDVHRLVALAFLGPCPPGLQVNHMDGKCRNNVAWNLEYVTPQENIAHAVRLGLHRGSTRSGEQHHRARLTDAQVEEIRRLHGARTIQHARENSKRALALRFGISRNYVKKLLSGKKRQRR